MTENLLHKLEERMVMLLTEVEELRLKVQQFEQENADLVAQRESDVNEKEHYSNKIRDLIALLDSVCPDNVVNMNVTTQASEPMAAQG